MTKPVLVYDLEIFHGYFLAAFMNIETGATRLFEMHDDQEFDRETVRRIIAKYRLVSFNGAGFDLPLLTYVLNGADCAKVKAACDRIIQYNTRPWQMGMDSIKCDHIDLIEVAPGIASLKAYGSRLHCPNLQDLPLDHDAVITPEQRETLRTYCVNDLRTTEALYRKLEPQIELREKMGHTYKVELRSKSDAQIAETIITREVERLRGAKLEKRDPLRLVGESFRYQPPPWIAFDTAPMVEAFERICAMDFVVGAKGVVPTPKDLNALIVPIGAGRYRMGIGGLHSCEKSTAHRSDDTYVLIDRDVTSYYPSIILRLGLMPEDLAPHFLPVYKSIVNQRLEAKRTGDKVRADALKITINGSFGKFGSAYSALYSPRLLIQTTITGQLALLMLIEMIEAAGGQVVSANTDGIVVKARRDGLEAIDSAVYQWETATGFDTEATEYLALYSRDVNNYIAIKPDGSVKLKGAYATEALAKAPTASVCVGAVVKHLVDGTPIEDSISQCQDVRKFLYARNVTGGAVFHGEHLGRVVRWYYALGQLSDIRYRSNNNLVPRTEGARPLMTLPDSVPSDLDREWYALEARSILSDIGATA